MYRKSLVRSLRHGGLFVRVSFATALVGQVAVHATAPKVEWIRQVGLVANDEGRGIVTDVGGNVYVVGATQGSLYGPTEGEGNTFLSKYDPAGNLQWARVSSLASYTQSWGISLDSLGSLYVAGAAGDGPGAFVARYDVDGNRIWVQQFGTLSHFYTGYGVSADGSGSVYVTGDTLAANGFGSDAYLAKYDSTGVQQWNQRVQPSLSGQSVSADALGNVFVVGVTDGFDAFVTKYDAGGNRQWIRELGTAARDDGSDVAADNEGNVYICGETYGSLAGPPAGNADAFLAKYDSAGAMLWSRQLGTTRVEFAEAISASEPGYVYIAGFTTGLLSSAGPGNGDAFISKYTAAGVLLWTAQLGSVKADLGYSIAADGKGAVYLTGYTEGDLAAVNGGARDAFVMKIIEVPEPRIDVCALFAIGYGFRRRRRVSGLY